MAKVCERGKETSGRLRRLIPLLGGLWLVAVGAFFLGVWTQWAQVWPHSLVQELSAFERGDKEEQSTLVDKLENDFGIRPERLLVDRAQSFVPNSRLQPLSGLPLAKRRAPVLTHLSEKALPGYRLIHGSFDFETGLHGALLLSPDGTVQQTWTLRQDDVAWDHSLEETTFPHGIDVLPDGSLVVAFDRGSQLARYAYCGEKLWTVPGGFHHAVTVDDDGRIWSFVNRGHRDTQIYLTQIDPRTGRTLRSISLLEVVEKNPDIDIFGVGQADGPDSSSYREDAWHPNDVEPLRASDAAAYPQFEAGDLLVSLRNLDLVFVLSPSDLRVKWWRQGLTRRQHDPDWNPRGTIVVFDNNMHRGVSRIVEIEPMTMDFKVLVDGARYDFYSRIRGKHQELPDGSRLVTSSQQGRVFEIAPSGEIVFELLNPYDDASWLPVAEAKFLPTDYFDELEPCQN